jgi:hypothetical protein
VMVRMPGVCGFALVAALAVRRSSVGYHYGLSAFTSQGAHVP